MTVRHRLVRVPASSANLGPGYDAMAAAVALHLDLEVEETGEFSLDPGGLDVSTGEFQAMMRVSLVNDGPVTLLLDSRKRF